MSTILPASAGCPSSVDLRRQRPGSASQPPLHLPQVQPDTVGPTLASVPESSPPGNTVVSRDAKMDSAIIGGVIAAMIFVVICFLVVLICYLYRHKGTYHTNEAKGTEFAENADVALKNDPNFQDSVDESENPDA
ncbi:glycophorin-C-like isoform X2 [Narcine bancroftii]|uniref:glycophorin-C-like isoform X2 n=1 Tax=Narcine bancroftii TaxID=1343680 RepID=UPI0038319742